MAELLHRLPLGALTVTVLRAVLVSGGRQGQATSYIRSIVIAVVDRLVAYAAHRTESEDPEITKAREVITVVRPAATVNQQRAARAREIENRRQNGHDAYETE